MKKIFLFAFIALALVALLAGQRQMTNVSAQSKDAVNLQDKNFELAQTIRERTNRSTDGLIQTQDPDGGFTVELQNRFQNIMLMRHDENGETASACVTSLGEANAFFGIDLETGELLSVPKPKSESSKLAAQYGMSEREFNFYKKLIEDAAAQRALSPSLANITISNLDGATEGFNEATAPVAPGEGGNPGATRGAQRLNVFTHAAGIWGAFLDSTITTTISSNFDPLTCTPGSVTLGAAGANAVSRDFPNAPFPNTWYHGALGNKIRNADPNLAVSEITARFNTNLDSGCFAGSTRFYYGLDTNTPANTTNLLIVVLHEMGHGLGFSSLADGATGTFFNSFPDIYLRFMLDTTTGKYWHEMTNAERVASSTNNGNVYWDGDNVKIASGFLTAGRDAATGRVRLYTPTTFSGGSSISHFDTTSTPSLLMEPFITPALPTDLDLSRQQMRDIGWYRDTNGDLVADTITNVAPTSGNVQIGQPFTVSWTNNGGFNRNVTIELSRDGGATYPHTLATNIANTGSAVVTTNVAATATARIRVREHSFVVPLGFSASNFSLSLAPTAATVAIYGRVADANGLPVSRAKVVITDGNGNTRTAQTGSFGYYRFDGVPAGANYVFSVEHRRYQFEPQLAQVHEDAEFNFVAND